MEQIKFINHASIQISNDQSSLLTDPWYDGDILNNGWSLLHKNLENDITETLNNTTHIWLSHEHPDHFSINFFNKYKDIIINKKIIILFQKTKDKRVYNFLFNKGFQIIEVPNEEKYALNDNFEIQIERFGFYDSALIIKINDQKIINMNDCTFDGKKQIKNFAKKYGPADLLLTQFSYAAWKGGKNNILWRERAAKEKILKISEQATAFGCNVVIPFASFNYFSNKENFYLNDSVNTPFKVKKELDNNQLNIIVMKPLETQSLKRLKQNHHWKRIAAQA